MTREGGTISVVIPALDEAARIADAVRSAIAAGADEILVVDGGSADATADEAARAGATRVIVGRRGRAAQMNAGAAASSSDILLFLHADTRLPTEAGEAVRRALLDRATAGGGFSVSFDLSPSSGTYARALLALTSAGIALRFRLLGTLTGDQAIFVRRALFERMGGYEEVELMEDVRLSAAMRKSGRTVLLREKAATSARRWEAHGPLRTILRMWFLRAAHAAGMSPARCAAIYRNGDDRTVTPTRRAGA